ncbi:magnesium and cobalt transport protein CorA [Skermania sp. ID1734]|uniref:magnesium and cobalt transport protein CorA n=1 Tax=Skermania sp. ID1734 TaxID=2597516 RepID=UPI00117F628C|nr:magnesium and cobalt transport protein CorA [Skermania sp. ID1734]TSE01894.1 magnesium and cobalt transport protein CorA [Skermania sp. ID1734]
MPSIPSLPPRRFNQRQHAATIGGNSLAPAADAIVDCAVYVDGERLPGQCSHTDALSVAREHPGAFAWVGLRAPNESQMAAVAQTFGLHELAAEDAVHAHQRPKLERYDDLLFLVLRTVNYVEHELNTVSEIVETGEIMVFVGTDFVVTVRHGDHTGLHGVRLALEKNPHRLALGPAAVLHAIADHVVDTYLAVTNELEDDVDEMEEAVFTPGSRVGVEPIYQLKREIVELRRSVNPLSGPLQTLTQEQLVAIPKEVRRYLRDVADHHTLVADRIAEFDETLSSLVDAALAKVTLQQNTDMRKISAWVAIAAVPTMVAGIYGMNFEHMPELQWTFGYPTVLGVIALICLGLYATFHRNDWL